MRFLPYRGAMRPSRCMGGARLLEAVSDESPLHGGVQHNRRWQRIPTIWLAHGNWRDGRPVQAAIGDGFADVLELDGGRGGEIGDGARYLEYAVIGARRQPEPFHRLFQQLGRVFFEAAYLIDLARGQRLIEAAAAFQLPVPRRRHPR